MSEVHDKQGDEANSNAANTTEQQTSQTAQDALSKLMGSTSPQEAGAAQKPGPDLERNALRAAEEALNEGARVLAEAESALRSQQAANAQQPQPSSMPRSRERILRALIAMNIVGMIVLVLLPSPMSDATTQTKPADPEVAVEPHVAATQDTHPVGNEGHEPPAPTHEPVAQTPSLRDPVLRAFALAESRDYQGAITLLEQHLSDSPRLEAGKKANVLLALEHYATQIGDYKKAQECQRKLDALRGSHSLPEDLVQMALEAERNGDVESMRRHYARLLLQQRQIPSSLYRHVAEAYLKLGDSYRAQAEKAESASREQSLEQVRDHLRKQGNDTKPQQSDGGHK